MQTKSLDVIIRVFVLTWVFFVLINIFWYFLTSNEKADASNTNKENFVSNDIDVIWNVWVAIATNIWTRQKEISETPVNLYKNVFSISEIITDNKKAKDEIITTNMLVLNEYLNVLKTDVKALINASNDRSATLNAFIAQLEYRYKMWVENVRTLNLQKTQLTTAFNSSNTKIANIKTKIASDYGKMDTDTTLTNIDDYLYLLQEANYSRTYIVFINKFLNSYAILNNYNKVLLDTLINNKEILIKNTQVVIPDSWSNLLKELNLIYEEKDWKE